MSRFDVQRRHALRRLATAGTVTALPGLTAAQAWPTRPIRLIVGFAPGGGTDIVARTMGARLSELLGAQVVVENRAGASGMIGADAVAKAAPDGYTLLMGHANSNVIAPNVVAKAPYDPAADFTPIHYIGYVPNVLAVHPGLAARSVDELVALARSRPGVLTYASSGVGSSQHLAGALFAKLTGVQVAHVPYKGSGQATTDLLAGTVPLSFPGTNGMMKHIKGGKLKVLATSGVKRSPQLPDVPTLDEAGLKGYSAYVWMGLLAPKGTPAAIVDKLQREFKASLASPEVVAFMTEAGIETVASTPAEMDVYFREERDRWARIVKETGAKVD